MLPSCRGDIAAILVIVGSLLPHLFPLNDSTPELCLINKKCCLLAQALSSTEGITNWQQFADWDRFGLAPSSKMLSLVSLPDTQWGLLVEVRVTDVDGEYTIFSLASSTEQLSASCNVV